MCPNITLLKSYKVYPRKHEFNYIKDKFFIYVYLNPFEEYKYPEKFKVITKEYCFAYQPVYIGKGTGSGYRQNQHLKAFISGKENNPQKLKVLGEIQDNMAKAAAMGDHTKPWNWEEYQKSYVVVLETFEDPKLLLKFEMSLINSIGTVFDRTGPLANKIKNAYKFDNLSTGRSPVL